MYQVILDNTEKLQDDLDSLEPKDRLLIMKAFLEFLLPKQRSIEAKVENTDRKTSQIMIEFINPQNADK